MQIKKWGNSLGIRIPKYIIEKVGYREGTEVDIEVEGSKIIIKPQKQTLKELVSKITPENKHEEVDFGTPEGKEKW